MSLPLIRRLGPRSTTRVLQSLGELRRQVKQDPLEQANQGHTIGRARFFRIGAGALIAAGMVMAGRTPAFADQRCAAAKTWVEANKHRLPQHYDAFIAYPLLYRRAIYQELPPQIKSRLWVEQLNRYQATHPTLSAEQHSIIHQALTLASDPTKFTPGHRRPDEQAEQLTKAARKAFGNNEAGALLATLGPTERPTTPRIAPNNVACECADNSDWCPDNYHCLYQAAFCNFRKGCGTLGFYVCNGLCDRN